MFNSIVDMLFNTVEKFPAHDALAYKVDGKYHGITYQDMWEYICYLSSGLKKQGVEPGTRIAILGESSYQWIISDYAIFACQGITVPIYPTLTEEQIRYMLDNAGVSAIFVDSQEQLDKVKNIKKSLPSLKWIFTYQDLQDKGTTSYQKLLKEGCGYHKANPTFFKQSVADIDREKCCTIVYTSGTTGDPKGVMLNHAGFVPKVINCDYLLNPTEKDRLLSFLPLSHLYERVAGHWVPLFRGSTIYYAESIKTVVSDIKLVKPTIMVSVPRLYQKIEQGILDKVNKSSMVKRLLFTRALNVGYQYSKMKRKGEVSPILKKRYQLAEKLVFDNIRQKMGGGIRMLISGGAPIGMETLKLFDAIGIRITEGYGMTETHLIITLAKPSETVFGSVGKPLPGVQVKIAEDGEILVKGDTIMIGYYGNNVATQEAISEHGWFHTGDIGYMNEDNYLFITDRKKNIIITSGGKNIAPGPIEERIKKSVYIEEICLIGDQQKFISALIVPNYDQLMSWADQEKIITKNHRELVEHPAVIKLINQEVDACQREFARVEKVKKMILLQEPFSIERGELTPSLKVKRRVVYEHYQEQIEALYQ